MVSVIDEATGLVELVEVPAVDEKATIDTIVEDEPDVSGRYLYTPDRPFPSNDGKCRWFHWQRTVMPLPDAVSLPQTSQRDRRCQLFAL